MINERPNKPRGKTRFARCDGLNRILAHPIRHEHITYAAHGLNIQRQFRILFDFPSKSRDLHVD